VTVDDELRILDENLRRLKIEYEVFFNGGSKKPPLDTEWRVKTALAKFSDGNLTYAQRFHYNAMAQKYATFADLWRKKMRIREEGYRRPQDALLAIQGVRTSEEHSAAEALKDKLAFIIDSADPGREKQDIVSLFNAMNRERRRHAMPESDSVESFEKFIRTKTQELRSQYGCQAVEYSVEMANGVVRIKARPK
jgi:hypothetical protein